MLSLSGAFAQGVVDRLVESKIVFTDHGISESKNHVYYSFGIPSGEIIQGHTQLSGASWTSLRSGQMVSVLYLPNGPQKNRLADYPQGWVSYLIMIAFPPLFGGVGIFLLLYALRPKTADRIGAFLHKVAGVAGFSRAEK